LHTGLNDILSRHASLDSSFPNRRNSSFQIKLKINSRHGKGDYSKECQCIQISQTSKLSFFLFFLFFYFIYLAQCLELNAIFPFMRCIMQRNAFTVPNVDMKMQGFSHFSLVSFFYIKSSFIYALKKVEMSYFVFSSDSEFLNLKTACYTKILTCGERTFGKKKILDWN